YEPYLHWDRLFSTFDPNGAFNNYYATLCWSALPICGAFYRNIFFVRIDSVLFEFYTYFCGMRRDFFRLNPQFKLGLSGYRRRKIHDLAIPNELKRIWRLRK